VPENEPEIVDVTIVGYGPVGQLLAAMLGQRGHRVVVFERWPELYGRARAGHLDDEAMRVIQSIGAAEQLESDAYRPPAYDFRNGAHELLMSLDWHRDGISGWASDYFTYQPDIEDAFTAQVSALPNVKVNMGFEVRQLTQTDKQVEITASRFERGAEQSETSETQVVRSRYVIGTDGANSFVRSSLGVDVTDLGFDEKWAVYDISPFAPLDLAYNDAQICDPNRPRCLFRIGDKRQRFEFMLLPGDDENHLATAEGAWELIGLFGLTPEHGTLDRSAVYQFRSLVTNKWRDGRVLLAGDAAHVMPPFLGQGLLSGIRDAASLGWRLDLVLRGLASDRLLNSYQLEREPHVTEIIKQSVAAGEVACMTDPEAAHLRDEAFWSGQVPPPPSFPALRGGVLADPPDLLTGTLAPQAKINHQGTTARFDDVYGHGWILLVRAGVHANLDTDGAAFLATIGGQIISVTAAEDVENRYERFFTETGLSAVLYRPDFRIFGTAADDAEIAKLVTKLRDRLDSEGDVGANVPDATLARQGAWA
jgi:2-polyprenyl-6-methoxyphenol hydroxylase-like FAD-dependent oxidoreductase